MLTAHEWRPAWLAPLKPVVTGEQVVIALLVGWGIVQTITSMFKPEITLGDALAIVVPISLAGAYAAYRVRRNRKPFVLMFADQPFDSDAGRQLRRTFRRSVDLKVGSAPVTLAIRTRIPTNCSPFGIRLVERSFPPWRWQNVPRKIVEIHAVRLPEWEKGADDVMQEPDEAGGWIISTKSPKPWVVGQYLWMQVVILSHEHWAGHISFEGRTSHRVFARRKIRFRHSSWAE